MEVFCEKCGKKSELKNIEKYRGRKVKFRCINKSCNEIVEIYVKESSDEGVTTVVTSSFQQELKGILRLLSKSENEDFTFELEAGMNLIGRQSSRSIANIQIRNDRFVSREHCFIEYKNDVGYLLYDNGSKNGVQLNNKQLGVGDKVYLKNSDKIQIGNTVLEFSNK